VTGSGDDSSKADGGDDDVAAGADEDLDELHPVSTSLRSAQHRGRETDASADAAEEQSNSEALEPDPDGLDEPAPVTSSLQSAQSQASPGDAEVADDAGDDDDVDTSISKGSGE
jgi:hypothetical protein